jgi:tetratricopeptide (TPR) repeat protein
MGFRERVGVVMVVAAVLTGGVGAKENPCVDLLTRLAFRQAQLEHGASRLHDLVRVAGDKQRPRIERFLARGRRRIDTLLLRHDGLVGRFREPACGSACALRLCEEHREELRRLNRHLGEELQALRAFEREMRGVLAEAQRVRLAIASTDRMIARAANPAGEPADTGSIHRAAAVQDTARRHLGEGRYDAALASTLEARDLVGRVVRRALDEEDAALVKRQARLLCERTRRMIAQSRPRVREWNNPRAAALLERASRENERGCAQIDEQPYRAKRAIGAARGTVGTLVGYEKRLERVDKRIAHLASWIEQAERLVEESGDERAATKLSRGLRRYDKAVALAEKGKVARAVRQLDRAAKLVDEAAGIARPGAD